MADTPWEVKLTSAELVLLDGKCSASTQEVVNRAKMSLSFTGSALTDAQAKLVADIVAEATTKKKLVFDYTPITYCRLCKRIAPPRLTQRGRPRRDGSQLTFAGIEFRKSFVRIHDHISLGGCEECVKAILPTLKTALEGVEAEMPESITGIKPRFKRHDAVKCKNCGWRGGEHQMTRKPALMSGTYPSGCPNCKAENRAFGPDIIETLRGEYVLVTTTYAAEESTK